MTPVSKLSSSSASAVCASIVIKGSPTKNKNLFYKEVEKCPLVGRASNIRSAGPLQGIHPQKFYVIAHTWYILHNKSS